MSSRLPTATALSNINNTEERKAHCHRYKKESMKSRPGLHILTPGPVQRAEGMKALRKSKHDMMNNRAGQLLKACRQLGASIFLPRRLCVAIEEDSVH